MAHYRDRYLIPRTQAGRPQVQVIGASPPSFPTGDRAPTRPGGCQVIGDYLAVAVGDNTNGLVRSFDLRPLARDSAPPHSPPPSPSPPRPSGRDHRRRRALRPRRARRPLRPHPGVDTGPLWSPDCRFHPRFAAPTGDAETIALPTDQAGDVHLLAFTSAPHRVRHRRVDLAAEGLPKVGEYPARLGVGVHIPDQNRIDLLRAAYT